MATLNEETTQAVTPSSNKPKITHYVNVDVFTKDGRPIRLGAFPVYENADKAQRTLIKMFEDGANMRDLDIGIDVRKNEKSTDTFNPDDWNTVERVEVAA